MTEKKRWVEPGVVSFEVPVVEDGLAEMYRAKAKRWADEAEARRRDDDERAKTTED